MAVLRSPDTAGHVSELAAIGVLCGIMCSVLALKFKFNLDLSRGRSVQETPTVVTAGVYKHDRTEQYGGSTSPAMYKPISPAMVPLPPPLPNNPPPKAPTQITTPVLPHPTPPITVHDNTVSPNPQGGPVHNRVKSTDFKAGKANQEVKPKLTKKEQRQLEKKEKERIKEQKKIDKKVIAEILKDDTARIEREAQLLKERQKEKAKTEKAKKAAAKNKNAPKPTEKPAETKPLVQPPVHKATNPLAQGNAPGDTLRSNISNSSGPPPYSASIPAVRPNETDISGNTSFGKPVISGGTWDMVSQHREQMKRPQTAPVIIKKVENSQYSTGEPPRPSTLQVEPARKSLYV